LEQERSELDPWSLYIYAMKAPLTRDKYKARLAKFLDFIGIEAEDGNRSLEDNARTFAKKSKSDLNWAFANLLKFIQFQKDRVDKKEIAAATVRNYLYVKSRVGNYRS
jgi:hypothetical protein